MFRIVPKRTAWWPVRFAGVTEEGKVLENEVELRFIILDEDAIVEFYARLAKANEAGDQLALAMEDGEPAVGGVVTAGTAKVALPILLEIVDGWRKVADENGKGLPFTPDNFLQFLKVPNAGPAIGRAYLACRAGVPEARLGN